MSEKDIDLTLTNAIIDKAMTKIRDRKPKSPSVPILDDDEVARIERESYAASRANVHALCNTVRALKAENERLKEELFEHQPIMVSGGDFRSRAIQLCRDKAAEYEQSAEDFKHDDRLHLCLSSKRGAYKAMVDELEQLK